MSIAAFPPRQGPLHVTPSAALVPQGASDERSTQSARVAVGTSRPQMQSGNAVTLWDEIAPPAPHPLRSGSAQDNAAD